MPTLTGSIAFYYLAAAAIASAILAITRANPVHSVLWVLALFMHVAGIFLLVGAQFLAAVQVIVYAGAILVFYLFFVMLLDLPNETAGRRFGAHWPLGMGAGIVFAVIVSRASVSGLAVPKPALAERTLYSVGAALFGEFALPFEVVSLVLLAAIVGAIVLARRKTEA